MKAISLLFSGWWGTFVAGGILIALWYLSRKRKKNIRKKQLINAQNRRDAENDM